jgi:hypothetical protein
MTWWNTVSSDVKVGDILRTPGLGMSGLRSGTFEIITKNNREITIESGESTISLPKECFDEIENFFITNPTQKLRCASLHDIPAFANSVDELIRQRTGSDLSRGHYVSSILVKCGLVKYSMVGRKKVIGLP